MDNIIVECVDHTDAEGWDFVDSMCAEGWANDH
jgi:hypothetical protein